MKHVPKGTSEYQAAWIVDDQEEEVNSDGDKEADEAASEAMDIDTNDNLDTIDQDLHDDEKNEDSGTEYETVSFLDICDLQGTPRLGLFVEEGHDRCSLSQR